MVQLNIRWQRFDKKKRIIALWVVVGVLAILSVLVWKFSDFKLSRETLVIPPSHLNISTYSVSGKVDSIGKDRIFYTAPVAYRDGDKVNIKYEPKIALVDDKTGFSKSLIINGKVSYQAIKMGNIQKGDKIIVYYSTLPYDKAETLATKVDLPQNY